jgi:hypothetical protein
MCTTNTAQTITASKTLRTNSGAPLSITNSSDSYKYNIYMASNSSSGQLQFNYNNSVSNPTIVFNISPGGSSSSNKGSIVFTGDNNNGMSIINVRDAGTLGYPTLKYHMDIRNGNYGASNLQ